MIPKSCVVLTSVFYGLKSILIAPLLQSVNKVAPITQFDISFVYLLIIYLDQCDRSIDIKYRVQIYQYDYFRD